MARALEIAQQDRQAEGARLAALRDQPLRIARITDVVISGHPTGVARTSQPDCGGAVGRRIASISPASPPLRFGLRHGPDAEPRVDSMGTDPYAMGAQIA
jgi:hypothetical protein